MLPVLASAPSPGRRLAWFDRGHIAALDRGKGGRVGYPGAMAFIAIDPLRFRPNILMARYIYRHYRAGFVDYS